MPVHVRVEEALDRRVGRLHRRPRSRRRARRRGGCRRRCRGARAGKPPLALGDHVLDEPGDDAADQFMDAAGRLEAGIEAVDLPQDRRRGTATSRKVVDVEAARPAGRRRCRGRHRRCRRRWPPPAPRRSAWVARSRSCRASYSRIASGTPRAAIARGRRAGGVEERAVVLDEPLQRLPGQIEAVEVGVAPLEPGDDAQRLGVVVEAAEARPCRRRARPRRYGRRACGRGRARAPAPRPDPRRARGSARARGRSALTSMVWVRRVRKWSPS